MTLTEWIAAYNKKTPDPFKRDERFGLFYVPDKGFAEIGQQGEMVIINQLAGDARFWKKAAENVARASGLKMGGTWCIRQEIKAYIRLFGYKVIAREELPDGLYRYHCRHKETGKQGLASPAFRYQSGEQAYYITWEV